MTPLPPLLARWMTTIYQWCRKSLSLRIRGKLIFSFSAAMIVLLSALGSITYLTFKDSIGASKKRIAELTLQNHVLGFHDLVENLQHDIGDTLFASDLGFSHNTISELEDTLAARTEADPFLSDFFLVRGSTVISRVDSPAAQQLQIDLMAPHTDADHALQHGLLVTGRQAWARKELPAAMGPEMAVFFSLDQAHLWETVLHENSREEGTLFFVTNNTDLIVAHLESNDHLESSDNHEGAGHHITTSHVDIVHQEGSAHPLKISAHHDDDDHQESAHHDDDHQESAHHDDSTTLSDSADHEAMPEHDDAIESDGHTMNSDAALLELITSETLLLDIARKVEGHDNELRKVGGNYVVASKLGLLDWHVYSVMPERIFIADLIKLRNRIISVTALTFWIALGIVLLVAHRISSPIISLSAATRGIQDQDYSTPLNFTRRRDEIGDLASNFETMRQAIEQLIHNDSLTGVFNRRYLLRALDQQVTDGLQAGEPLSFIMIDLDRFKSINDTHGHMAGDCVLKAAALAIDRSVDGIGILARYGGEEFCVLLPGIPGPQAQEIAENIRGAVQDLEIHVEGQALSVTCSLGVAAIDNIEHYRELAQDQLIRILTTNADLALYHAKDTGRNRSVTFTSKLALDKAA